MRRNLGSEVTIAIGAVAIIICGLFFALLLSNPSNPPSPTNISSSLITSVAQSNTDDITVTSETIVELDVTNTPELKATETGVPSETPLPTATDTEVPSETPMPTATDTEIPSETPMPTVTDTEIPSETPLPTATDTEVPSETPLPTATDTEVPSETPMPTATEIPSETPMSTVTDTEIPSETPLPTATDTEVPSETPLPTATDTEVPSETPLPTATDTEVPSETPLPTATDTEVPSETPMPTATEIPSETPTATLTLTPSNTPRPTASATSENAFIGIIPTLPPSPTVAPLDEPTRTPASCDLPQGWTTYLVQPGDTLFAIALATNSTVDELRFANCIDDIDNIIANLPIFVPVAPLQAVSTLVPSGIRQGLAAVGCTSAITQITSPITAQRVSGTFTVFGTAMRSDFQYYKIEVRPDFAEIYNFYSNSQTQVTNGALGHINAELFGEGLHWIRLSVVDVRAEIQPDAICEIPVIFE